MGLAGAKNKRRLGNDPNNTKWSRNTETFGQKLLRSQGWEPGQYLGSKDATHAVSYTEASTSHIRVTMKDDVLGLGAKRNNGDECTGLNAFQHLLGRLNGKSEDILAAEAKKREDTKLSLYVERKMGRINFVKGGWLVGDTLKGQPSADASEVTSGEEEEEESTEVSEPAAEKKSSRKRKAEQEDTEKGEDKEARKKEKKSKRRKTDTDDDAETDSENTKDKMREKKSKKRKITDSEEGDTEPTESSKSSKKNMKDKERQSTEGSSEDVDDKDAKKAAKKEKKKEKKREKKAKEEKRKKDKSASESGAEDKGKKNRKKEKEASTSLVSGASTPTEGGSGYSTPTVTTNTRYLARSRFIAQKKLAFADTAALNQIFMIKS